MSEWVIQTSNLARRYGSQTSVNEVNMRVKSGGVYGFLGPNGAGKTTTIRLLLGLIRPTSGEIHVFGQPLSKNRVNILKRVGSLVESPSYYGHLTGRENLQVIARILGASEARIHEVLEIVRLTSAASKLVKGYSLGMKQRLGIATALLGNPELLVLDEPTNGLDPSGIHEIRELIVAMPSQYGITVLVSSHLLTEIDQMATQVGIINEGQLIFENDIDVLRRQNMPYLHYEVNAPEQAQRLLRSLGYETKMQHLKLTIQSLDDDEAALVTKSLVLAGISVYRITETRTSLEDTFLQLVGKAMSL